jgi:hypothetical protein
MAGATHEVVSAYESAMARGECNGHQGERERQSNASFTGWEIDGQSGDERHVLKTLGQVTFRFSVDIRKAIKMGLYGVALRNHDQQVVWAWETQSLELDSGERHLRHTFPTLPLRPGIYTWIVALYDDAGNLMDMWDCIPEMIIATEVFQHPRDEWASVLNMPVGFDIDGRSMPR